MEQKKFISEVFLRRLLHHVLGIDTPKKDDLIAANMSVEELKDYLGVDSLEFLSIDNLKVILGSSDHCFGCFTRKISGK